MLGEYFTFHPISGELRCDAHADYKRIDPRGNGNEERSKTSKQERANSDR